MVNLTTFGWSLQFPYLPPSVVSVYHGYCTMYTVYSEFYLSSLTIFILWISIYSIYLTHNLSRASLFLKRLFIYNLYRTVYIYLLYIQCTVYTSTVHYASVHSIASVQYSTVMCSVFFDSVCLYLLIFSFYSQHCKVS